MDSSTRTKLTKNVFFFRFFRAEDLCIKSDEPDQPVLLSAQEGHRNRPCTIVFLLVYFFATSVTTWFTATMIAWSMASARISQPRFSVPTMSTLTHVYGWGIPALLTIVAIVAHQVKNDGYPQHINTVIPNRGAVRKCSAQYWLSSLFVNVYY